MSPLVSNVTLIARFRLRPHKRRTRNKCPSESLVWMVLKHWETGCTFIDRSFMNVLGLYLAAESERRFGAHCFRYCYFVCFCGQWGKLTALLNVILPSSVPVKSLDPLRKRWIIRIFRLCYVIFDSGSWLVRWVCLAKEIANWLPHKNIVNLLSADVNLFLFWNGLFRSSAVPSLEKI